MAFSQMLNRSNDNKKVCNFGVERAIRGRSTRQISLGKIVNTICSVSPPGDLKRLYSSPLFNVLENGTEKSDFDSCGFDLNLPLGSSPPRQLSDDCGTVEKSSVVERDLTEHETSRREERAGTEITGVEMEETGIVTTPEAPPSDSDQHRIFNKGEGCLELLIEAAKFISGGFEDDLEAEEIGKRKNSMLTQNGSAVSKGKRSKRVRETDNRKAAEFRKDLDGNESTSVRRSRSGRCNVLPSKYRDSIVDPLSALCGQRSSASVTSKRK